MTSYGCNKKDLVLSLLPLKQQNREIWVIVYRRACSCESAGLAVDPLWNSSNEPSPYAAAGDGLPPAAKRIQKRDRQGSVNPEHTTQSIETPKWCWANGRYGDLVTAANLISSCDEKEEEKEKEKTKRWLKWNFALENVPLFDWYNASAFQISILYHLDVVLVLKCTFVCHCRFKFTS